MRISIIIPTYNERENIKRLIPAIFGLNIPDLELIVVDDNSPDGTYKVAQNLSLQYPVKVICRQGKLGLGSAVIAGFQLSKSEILGVMDADLSHPFELIPKLLKELENNDLVIASRLIKDGGVEEWPWFRKAISKIGIFLARPLTKVKDPLSGFFFLKRKVIDNVNLTCQGYKILLEILVKGKYQGIKEIPFVFRNRELGSSKLNFKEYFDYLKLLTKLYFYKIKSFFNQ